MVVRFDYTEAFSRNIGWLTQHEQAVLRSKRIAIAGLGGVGGSHLLTLARLGIARFTIADFDTFELANFNRQAGSGVSTIGVPKSKVLVDRALQINPELDLKVFSEGVNTGNMEEFTKDADLFIDGLDFFAVDIRREIFATCARTGLPAITVAPLGMGASLLNFLPDSMTFEEYFRLDGYPEDEQLLRFLLGLSPAMLQRRYLVEPGAVQLKAHRGPSTPMACRLCAGIAGTEALKILLKRGNVIAAPRGLHFDAYQNRLVRTWRPWGNRNPIQRLGLMVARKRFGSSASSSSSNQPDASPNDSPATQILDLARWAPSGDNSQPWRFEIIDHNHIVIHGHDTRDHCVYDLRGYASQLAIGTLLQTITIAASNFGMCTSFARRHDAPETKPTIDVMLTEDPAVQPDPLLPYITTRTVNRRRLSTRPLMARERTRLESSPGHGYRIKWFASFDERMNIARMLYRNGGLRLHLPEAYQTHKSVIEWNSRTSEDRIPDRAVGLDPVTMRLMRFAISSWQRVSFLNTYLGGSLIPQIELDFIPGLACAAHFIIIADNPPAEIDDYIDAGKAVQRFWLTATQLGLQLQPEMTPVIFSTYIRDNVDFTQHEPSLKLARSLAIQLNSLIEPESAENVVFMGRIGAGPLPSARSVRLPLEKLLV